MSKITFRADDDLVERVESLDTSKSEVMRDALRSYLDGRDPGVAGSGARGRADGSSGGRSESDGDASSRAGTGEIAALLDDLVAERVDEVLASRLEESPGRDVNVTVQLETDGVEAASVERATAESSVNGPTAEGSADSGGGESGRECAQCGEDVAEGHVYCPNCGEKATRRVFCECGDEIRSDWAYCPGCGRRTPSAELLEQ